MKRACLGCVLLIACGGPTGDVTVLVEGEDTITNGLDPEGGEEGIVDGWTVRFDRYLVAVGDVVIERTSEDVVVSDERVQIVDLRAIGASGAVLSELEALDAERWDSFTYRTPLPADATRHESAVQADFDEMVANGWTYLIEGTLMNASGQSCPPGGACRDATELSFRLGVDAPARFGPCESEDGLPGVTVTEGGTTVAITFHGDHMFFDRFPAGAEVIERRAQWLADADTDADGAITRAELEAIEAGELFPSSLYSLSGAPLSIVTAWDYVRAQVTTQGHFQGEGECPWEPQ
jgi:hypothetical protein